MLTNYNDTITQIASGLTNSGISIIRISGSEAIDIADKIFRGVNGKDLKSAPTYTLHYGNIVKSDKIIDEVIVSVMRAPKSYTCEDVIEINCHGGYYVTNKILNLICENGARLAEPGEFTKRAFLNGRIDLSEAEAVMDIINSDNEYSLKAGMNKLSGRLRDEIVNLRKTVLHEVAYIESALDDPEHISLEGYEQELEEKVNCIESSIDRLIYSYDNGKIMNSGISTVIIGKPNAGKSSFLNYLIGEDRAIVTDIAGTTRDFIEEYVNIEGIKLKVIDTAGIRNTEDYIEQLGVDRALEFATDADLCVFIADSSIPFDEDDHKIISHIKNKKIILLYNKIDKDCKITVEEIKDIFRDNGIELGDECIIRMSVVDLVGREDFCKCVKNLFEIGDINLNNEIVITSLRQKENLTNARKSLDLVKEGIMAGMPEDCLTIDLMNCYTSLGLIIGEEVDDDVVNEIFSSFCMGK